MKLTGHRIDVAAVPYEAGRRASHILLRLRTDGGVEGLGYVSLVTAAAWQVKPIVATLEVMVEQIGEADLMATEAINHRLLAMCDGGPMAGLGRRCAAVIDVALWDIKGKALGQPVATLLGGYRDRAPVYASWQLWWTYDLPTLKKNAQEILGMGYRAMKFRLGGVSDPEEIAARCAVMREAVGDDVALMADANQSWTLTQALAMGRALEPYRLYWLEDPVPFTDLHGLAEVSRALGTPLATGESYHEAGPFRELFERHATEIAIIDLDVGGLTQWMKIAALAQAYGVPVAGHTAPEALVHAVSAAPNGCYVEHIPWMAPLIKDGPERVDGQMVVPARPGLGLELDEAALRKYAV